MTTAQPSARRHASGSTSPATEGSAAAEPEPRWRIAVDLVEDGGDWSEFTDIETLVERAAAAVAAHDAVAARRPADLCEAVVVLSSDAEVAKLNGHYRGKPKPTNVLSFPAAAGTPAGSIENAAALGDIVLAAETVRAEAADGAIEPAHHLQHLVVHGILHLLGFDHLMPAEAEIMEAHEIDILARLGVPNPYAGSDPIDDPT